MHASKDVLPTAALGEGYETRLAEWGEYTAYFERARAGTDFSAHYESCRCPHLGYVFRGKIRFVYDDGRDEIVSAGEMYYVPPGHTFQVIEDAETVEFSPTRPYREHMDSMSASDTVSPHPPAPVPSPQPRPSLKSARSPQPPVEPTT
jgi:hypothetical protein